MSQEELLQEVQHMQTVIDRVALIRLDLESENIKLKERNELLEADKRRMDYLESEAIREIDLQAPRSLFRRNVPIMRAAIDEALAAVQGKSDE